MLQPRNDRSYLKKSSKYGLIPSNKYVDKPEETKTINDILEEEVCDTNASLSNTCNSEPIVNKSTSKIFYGVLFGKVENDNETVYLKKVCESQNDAVEYVHNFVKDYIVKRHGIDHYTKHSFTCSIINDFGGPSSNKPDGLYVLKNNNSWSIYRLSTKLVKGYIGTYAEKKEEHLFNLYVAKEGYGYMVIEKDQANYRNVMNELKLKIHD